MAKGCLLEYMGTPCGEFEKYPNKCVYLLNEGMGDKSLTEYLKRESVDWLVVFANNYAFPNGIYCECVMANVIREAILHELSLR